MANILIIDDNKEVCSLLCRKAQDMGHTSTCAHTLSDGIGYAETFFDVVFLDVRLPDGNGLAVLPEIKSFPSNPEVIIITGEGDPDGAETAVTSGAWDYIEKPLSLKDVALQLMQALTYRKEKLSHKASVLMRRQSIVGNAPNLMTSLELAAKSANTDANVLITGETGTGKELFAKAIHENSSRSEENFVVVDCTSLPETLVESILFGHEKGAFTGADERKAGLIKEANGGTLFLDEVGELPLNLQKTFLRVLQEHRFRPVGGKSENISNFRLIAATNRNLEKMCDERQFRQDLLFRIKTVEINLPPLRERRDDIELLIPHFISKICKRYRIGVKGYSPEFLEAMKNYDWPGNIRELANVIDGAICDAQHQTLLYPKNFPTHIRVQLVRKSLKTDSNRNTHQEQQGKASGVYPTIKAVLEKTEKEYLSDILMATNGDVDRICDISGLSRTRFYTRLKKYNLSRRS